MLAAIQYNYKTSAFKGEWIYYLRLPLQNFQSSVYFRCAMWGKGRCRHWGLLNPFLMKIWSFSILSASSWVSPLTDTSKLLGAGPGAFCVQSTCSATEPLSFWTCLLATFDQEIWTEKAGWEQSGESREGRNGQIKLKEREALNIPILVCLSRRHWVLFYCIPSWRDWPYSSPGRQQGQHNLKGRNIAACSTCEVQEVLSRMLGNVVRDPEAYILCLQLLLTWNGKW